MSTDQVFKADGGKPDPTLLEVGCVNALESVQGTLDYGAIKYEAHSWKRVDMQRYNAAARRHRIARDRGEVYDKESGLPHLAHEIVCNLFQLQMLIETGQIKNHTKFKQPPLTHKVAASGQNS